MCKEEGTVLEDDGSVGTEISLIADNEKEEDIRKLLLLYLRRIGKLTDRERKAYVNYFEWLTKPLIITSSEGEPSEQMKQTAKDLHKDILNREELTPEQKEACRIKQEIAMEKLHVGIRELDEIARELKGR